MADTKAKLTLNGDTAVELDVLKGTLGQDVIDIRTLGSKGVFTFDPGFTSTASCESKITFIDGDEGILLHRGFPSYHDPRADYPSVPRFPSRLTSNGSHVWYYRRAGGVLSRLAGC